MQHMVEWGEIIVKIVTESQDNTKQNTDAAGEQAFLDALSPALLKAVCRSLDAPMYPMAQVSEQLMVLRQTRACDGLLARGSFYSLREVLQPAQCDAVQHSLRTGTQQTVSLLLSGQCWTMHIWPEGEQALLVFQCDMQHQAGVSMAAAHLRDSAARLLLRADEMKRNGLRTDACFVRREALRILREANHASLLSGAPEPMRYQLYTIEELFCRARQQLARLGVPVVVQQPVPAACLRADAGLLLSALMTLVSNSLRHGGEQVHIRLHAAVQENGVVFAVDDDGTGLSTAALERMDDTWRQTDVLVGGWGLGIPYARRIAELHGGSLFFAPGTGCMVRMFIPMRSENGFAAAGSYRPDLAAGATEADIELSDVLDAVVFDTD